MKATAKIALDWAVRCFGREHVYSRPVRALRLAEEAIELAQALNIPKDQMLALVELVYNRPPGVPDQELGGVAMVATLLAATGEHDLDDFLEEELRRVLAKPTEHFAKRNQEKIKLGMGV